MIDGGPSVLYDAVALLPAAAAMDDLLQESTARDFVADAFAHCKFIGYVNAAVPLFEKAGIAEADLDEGCCCAGLIEGCCRFCRQAWPVAGLEPRATRQDEIVLRQNVCLLLQSSRVCRIVADLGPRHARASLRVWNDEFLKDLD